MSIQRNKSFYDIGSEYLALLPELYNTETGEVNMEIQAQIDALEQDGEKKCIAVSSYIKKLEAEEREIQFMKKEILERESAYHKEIDRMHSYLKTNMLRCGISVVKSRLFTIKLKTNPYSTDIDDESQIPERFMRTREIIKVERKPDKNAIKEEVLKTGIQVPGANVAQKLKIEILTDKL